MEELTVSAVLALLPQDPKAVVIACNTATAAALPALQRALPHIPVIGIQPAVAQAAHAYCVPFMALRTVTDTPEHEGQDVFDKNCLSASKVNAALLVKLILSLPH